MGCNPSNPHSSKSIPSLAPKRLPDAPWDSAISCLAYITTLPKFGTRERRLVCRGGCTKTLGRKQTCSWKSAAAKDDRLHDSNPLSQGDDKDSRQQQQRRTGALKKRGAEGAGKGGQEELLHEQRSTCPELHD